MSPTAVNSTPSPPHQKTAAGAAVSGLARFNSKDPAFTTDSVIAAIKRDGAAIVENFISQELAARVKREVGPHLDNEGYTDRTGFFSKTTQRITGLLGKSPACVELLTAPIGIDIANALLTSTYSYWLGDEVHTAVTKPILSSTAAFRINPGSKHQVLHRDDADWHPTDSQLPILLGCLTATTRTTVQNGATRVIPGSHTWTFERKPQEPEVVQAELEIGDSLIFLGNVYHGGGANTTEDESRETVGMFYNKGFLRPAETLFLEVPLQKAAQFSKQVQRLLGYGISAPGLGLYEFQDPMEVLFKVKDEENENWGQ